jgi:ParB/RepB/Spo0J family partition protein
MTTTNGNGTVGELRRVALSRIHVQPDFNPRTTRDPKKFAQLVASVREEGVLQPLLVADDGDGGFRLIAGEGRYLAAGEAGVVEVPVLVRDVDERTGGLELALAENLSREDLDPVQEAHAFARLKQAGYTKKGIAERLGVSQKLVGDRLAILDIPAELHPQIADRSIPPSAIKPLVALGKIHPGLPSVVVARVAAAPAHQWNEPLTWAQVVEDPIAALVADYEGDDVGLPSDVFDAGESYPIGRFSLSEKATKDLRALCKLLGIEPEQFVVRFGREAIEHATALNAAHASRQGWHHIIVGQDVGDELAAQYIAACLKSQRATARRERAARAPEAADGAADPDAASGARLSEEEVKEQRRRERQAEQERRRQAAAYNLELGAAVLKHLARVKVDERVIKIIAAIDFSGELGQIAARGARYGFPGWPQETATKGGKAKTEYLHSVDAGRKAREFVAAATSAAEVAGRLTALAVMARYTKEDCVAQSARSFYALRAREHGLPWGAEVIELIEQVAEERLPEHLIAHVREERQREAAAREAERAAVDAANALRGRLDELTAEERLEALRAFGEEHGRHTVVAHWLRQDILRRNAQDERDGATEANGNNAQSDEHEPPVEAARGEQQPGSDCDGAAEPVDRGQGDDVSASEAVPEEDGQEVAAAA